MECHSIDQQDYTKTAAFLVLGKTGAGKTTLINAFVNHLHKKKYEEDRLILIPQKVGQKCSFDKYASKVNPREAAREANGISKTDDVTSYLIETNQRSMQIIDTPGFGDTRGFKRDKLNLDNIVKGIRQQSFIQAILLVIDSACRKNHYFKHCLDEIRKIMTKSCLNQCIVICTREDGDFNVELKRLVSKTLEFEIAENNWYVIDNECLFGTASDDSTRDIFKESWEKASEVFEQIYEKTLEFPKILTNKMGDLFKKRQEIEKKIQELTYKIDSYTTLLKKRLLERERSEVFRNYTEKFIEEESKKPNIRLTYETNYNCEVCNKTCIFDTSRTGYVMGTIVTLSIYHWIREFSKCDFCDHAGSKHSFERYFRSMGLSAEDIRDLRQRAEKIGINGTEEEVKEAFISAVEEIIEEKTNEIAKLAVEIEELGIMPVTYDSYLNYLQDAIYLLDENETLDPKEKITQRQTLISELNHYMDLKEKVRDCISNKSALLKKVVDVEVSPEDKAYRIKFCLNNHFLEFGNTGGQGFICEICHKEFEGERHECRACNYDVCQNCYR